MYIKKILFFAFLLAAAFDSAGSLCAGVLRVEFKNLQQVADTVTFDIETVLLDDTIEYIDSLTLAILPSPAFAFDRLTLTPSTGWGGALDTNSGLVDLTATPGTFPDPPPGRLIYNQPQLIGTITIDTAGLPSKTYKLTTDPSINAAFGYRNGVPDITDGVDIEVVGNSFTVTNVIPEPSSATILFALTATCLWMRRRSIG